METRTIAIANTKTQRRYTIESNATTLGELQDQMTQMGIDFTGMSFTEGLSKTTLISRDSLLPTNVQYKGQPTNNLVMLLTNTTKNIASGALSRAEVYQIIKENNLQEGIKEYFGRNYTQVPTNFLIEYLDTPQENAEPEAECNCAAPSHGPACEDAPHAGTVEWLYDGIKRMVNDHALYVSDLDVLLDLLTELNARTKESQIIADEDIDAMIAGL